MGVGQRPQQHLIEQAEDRGVGADAHGNGQHRSEGEQGLPAQSSEGVPQVAHGRLDGCRPRGVGIVAWALGAPYQAVMASSNNAASWSGPAGRGESFVTRCCGNVPSTSAGMSLMV